MSSPMAYSPATWFFDTFYGRLFEVAPSVRPLFGNSLLKQGKALIRMIGVIVKSLDQALTLSDQLERLAVRHLAYGAQAAHYAVVGEVLLYSLEECIGEEEWTHEMKAAWLTAYSVMMTVMLPVAYARKGPAASKRALILKALAEESAVTPHRPAMYGGGGGSSARDNGGSNSSLDGSSMSAAASGTPVGTGATSTQGGGSIRFSMS